MLRSSALALFLLALPLAGCGAADDAIDTATDTHTATMRGAWRGTDGVERPARLVLTQDALSASITLELDHHPCVPRSVIGAKLTTSGLEGTAQIGGMHIKVTGDPDLEEIIGNFEAISNGPCPDQARTFDVLFRR